MLFWGEIVWFGFIEINLFGLSNTRKNGGYLIKKCTNRYGRLLTVLLTLCLVLSAASISAFAESGAYAVKLYPGDYGTMTKNDRIPEVQQLTKRFYLHSGYQKR